MSLFLLTMSGAGIVRAQEAQVLLEATRSAGIPILYSTPKILDLKHPDLARDFGTTLLFDLKHSGVLQVLEAEPAADKAPVKAPSPSPAPLHLKTTLGKGLLSELRVEVDLQDPTTGKRVFQKAYSGKEIAAPRMAHRIADDIVEKLTGVRGVADSLIVFCRETTRGVKEIFQIDPSGSGPVQLTRHESLTISPSVSRDGKLAYLTYKSGPPEIWGETKPGGSHVRLFPRTKEAQGNVSTPVWAPDNRHLALVQGNHRGDSDILLLDVHSHRLRQITGQSGICTEPTWAPSGRRIAFTSDREGMPQVYLMDEDGSNLRRLTTEGRYNASPAWSPQGDMIAYVSRFEGSFDLFVYKLAEGRSYQITHGMGSCESPAWSPDGRWLVFSSTRDVSRQLFITDLSGQKIRKVSDLADCQSPQWGRNH